MPYAKKKSGEKWVVYNETSGKIVGTHDNKQDADDQLAALYTNVEDVKKSLPDRPMHISVPITKIDEEKKEVWGYATIEVPDQADEIMDYATSKPNFAAWSESVMKMTGGKSKGNLRSMHSNWVAGHLISIQFDDVNKGVYIGAHVTDPVEFEKAKNGDYSGFSIGGDYGKIWPDPKTGLKRYTAKPNEISLVDAPCNPAATFDLIKANGIQKVAFRPGSGEKMLKLSETSQMTAQEQREFLNRALAISFPRHPEETNENMSPVSEVDSSIYWLQDFSKDVVYVCYGDNKYFSIPYTVDENGAVTFGTPQEVVRQTTYVPVPPEAAPQTPPEAGMAKAIPTSPPVAAETPLTSEVGMSLEVQQMAPTSSSVQVDPSKTPDSEQLASAAVGKQTLEADFDEWLPKLGKAIRDVVGEVVREEIKKSLDEHLKKVEPAAPARKNFIPVRRSAQ